jgi:hypothetical protein
MEFKEFFYLMEKKGFAPFGFDHGVRQMPHTNTGPVGTHIPNVPGIFGALTAQWTGSQPGELPSWQAGYFDSNFSQNNFDLALPTTERSGIITYIDEKRNPIIITYRNSKTESDSIYIPYDDFKRVQPCPDIGRTITVVMQRRMDDASKAPSKIQTIKVF